MKNINDGLFSDLFDFDGDGNTDPGEEFTLYEMFDECMNGNDDDDFSSDNDIDPDPIGSKDFSWRSCCEDGTEFLVFPEDYDTEEEYEEALEEAKYAWRDSCEDGSVFGLDPDDYETEEEYEEALEEAKYAWRDSCEDGSDFGVDPEDYETEEEYSEALDEAKDRWRDTCDDGADVGVDPGDCETEEESKEQFDAKANEEDRTIYTICKVAFDNAKYMYNYKTNDSAIALGDKVLVPFGDSKAVGTVVSVGQFFRIASPFPVDKMKSIIKKVTDDS